MNDYPPTLTIAPLTTWPGEATKYRIRSPFSATLRGTLNTLELELFQLRARNPVLEVAIEPGQFRIDGRPRVGAKASHPGVVLSLPKTKHGPMRYAADRFDDWTQNLRAIALGMEALRKVDRYGITSRHEQYTGFKAIAPPEPADGFTSHEEAARFIYTAAGVDPEHHVLGRDIDRTYRAAARRLHPDSGGDTAEFQRLQDAMRLVQLGLVNR